MTELLRDLPREFGPVLGELFLGSTDAAASRHLNMSARTYSRRVSELLDQLDVYTRFQCGFVLGARTPMRPATIQHTFAEVHRGGPLVVSWHSDHIG
jgi:hypothetical protein